MMAKLDINMAHYHDTVSQSGTHIITEHSNKYHTLNGISGASDSFWYFNHDSNYVVGISSDTLLDIEVIKQTLLHISLSILTYQL